MDVDRLDAAILSHAGERWLKVARIAGEVLAARGASPSDDQVGVVIDRIEVLVAQGRLEARGNPRRPRFSEVRSPGGEALGPAPGGGVRR